MRSGAANSPMANDDFDVVVIGTGAGATSLIRHLVSRGFSICALERGHDIEPPTRPTDEGAGGTMMTWASRPNVMADESGTPRTAFAAEATALGGGTIVYTGNVLRFAPQDFQRRTILGEVADAQVADWPLDYAELAAYYTEIERELGVAGELGTNPFEPPRAEPFPSPAVPYDVAGQRAVAAATKLGWHPFPLPTVASATLGRSSCGRCGLCTGFVCSMNARWSARTDLRLAEASGRLTIRLNSTAIRVETNTAGDRAEAVLYLDASGQLKRVRGRAIVLAANAIQTPRLLLSSATARHPNGLCNGSDQVGRNLMTHAMDEFLTVGHIPGAATLPMAAGCTVAIQDFYDPKRSGVALPFTLEPRAVGSFQTFSNMVRTATGWAGLDEATIRARHRDHVLVVSMVEDLPRAQNRVELHPFWVDPLGQQVAIVHYTPHALDRTAAAAAGARARELLLAAGAHDIASMAANTGRLHTMGTCRMGLDPNTSVVHRDGHAHEVPNLYVADASVFVSSAGVNPSLTVQALARRTAVHLAGSLTKNA